jgi:uncharacterized membrane protein
MDLVFVIVRAVHVVLAVFWAGTVFFVATFLDPSVRAAGPAGARVMQALQQRRFTPTIITAGAITLLTGLALYGRMAAVSPAWARSPIGMMLGFGALAGVAALATGVLVSRPTFRRMSALIASSPESGPTGDQQAEVDRLRGRLRLALRWTAGFLLVAVLAMALARYV